MKAPIINTGDLIQYSKGGFGIITRVNKKDNLYTIIWTSQERGVGRNLIYDKNIVDHLIKKGDWKHLLNKGKTQ